MNKVSILLGLFLWVFSFGNTFSLELTTSSDSKILVQVNSQKGHDYSGSKKEVNKDSNHSSQVKETHEKHVNHGPIKNLSHLWVIPFALLLLSIAIFPLVAEHWWEENMNKAKISFPLGILVACYLAYQYGPRGIKLIEHSAVEFIQFIVLLGALYIISGGIVVRGKMIGSTKLNAIFLSIGALIASFVGTTGASMLLIRPMLRANACRKHVVHTVVFFIFMVSNIGGCLTPLGDPPLFLGFLKGVPFTWTFSLWPEWLLMNAILLGVYIIWDYFFYYSKEGEILKVEEKEEDKSKKKVSIVGILNFVWLLGVVLCVAFLTPSFLGNLGLHPMTRELVMVILIILSLVMTDKKLRAENEFNYHPITEVAVLFVGIFITMIPAINSLKILGPSLGVTEPMQFFWGTGLLSSFLDNAPTYVVFFELAKSLGLDPNTYGALVAATGVPAKILAAISLGAVFMGANSYIGNGPNFMVKAIAEQSGIKMPSFFGYMAYSFGVLVPLLVVVSLIFF